jgi:hypothetical protein
VLANRVPVALLANCVFSAVLAHTAPAARCAAIASLPMLTKSGPPPLTLLTISELSPVNALLIPHQILHPQKEKGLSLYALVI